MSASDGAVPRAGLLAEPGAVSLPPEQVAALRALLARDADGDPNARGELVGHLAALLDASPAGPQPAGETEGDEMGGDVCRTCRRPFSPSHNVNAPGPTVRHPFKAR